MLQTDRVRSYSTTRIGIPSRDQYEANHDSEREIRPPIRCNERRRLLVRRCPLQSPGHRLADTKTTPSIACALSTSWLPSAPPKFAQPPRKLWKLQTSPSIVNEEHGNRGARVIFDPYCQFSYVGQQGLSCLRHTCLEGLAARDVLQGKRVDMEKGAASVGSLQQGHGRAVGDLAVTINNGNMSP
ncbi:hypothetical protein CCMSSC00406_0010049 [Pleurotus cornucopiae]|uniref:Uncharacterized protein n=1 Tax=Pleurotus cornucopiae TaxID=5321 RepID=A0ACB7IKM4_PLECO|nr:hypothetical protein CCMSSC00406_0010049 [Pleurotus cornucopiae]